MVHAFAAESWNMSDTVEFTFQQLDTINTYNLYFVLNHRPDYKYSNFFIYTRNLLPNGLITKDTIETYLAKPSGEWIGSEFLDKVHHKVLFAKNSRFPMAGYYKLNWVHGMRDTVLNNIMSIGLVIEKQK